IRTGVPVGEPRVAINLPDISPSKESAASNRGADHALHSSREDSVSLSLEDLATPALRELLQLVEDRLTVHPALPEGIAAAGQAREEALRWIEKAGHAIAME